MNVRVRAQQFDRAHGTLDDTAVLIGMVIHRYRWWRACGIMPVGEGNRNDGEGSAGGGVNAEFAFVSYAREDFAYVRRLVSHLGSRGVNVWFDDEIPNGERWASVLHERIGSCTAFVLVMSPAAGESEWVKLEVELARSLGKPIRPLRLAGEVIFDLDEVQYDSVLDQQMPSYEFVESLPRRGLVTDRLPLSRVRHLVGVVPNAADCFQDRDLLYRLGTDLASGAAANVTQILTGLGGAGKTQLAAAIARRRLDEANLEALVWVTANNRNAVVSAYAQAGHEVRGADMTDTHAAAESFLRWLASTTGQWLIVLDDVADPADIAGLWPPATLSGQVVVTTRRRDAALASHGHLVTVGLFTPAEARAYLAQKIVGPGQLVDAGRLAAELGYLPLMLAQAAAFITDQDITCDEYLNRFGDRTRLVDVLPAPGEVPDDYRRPVAATLLLSVDAADRLRPVGLAYPVLTLLSLLDADGIPTDLIEASATTRYLAQHRRGDVAGPVTAQQARDAVACLARLNLVDTVIDTQGRRRIRVHALVQRATRDQLSAEVMRAAATAMADALVQVWPDIDISAEAGRVLRANAAGLRIHAEQHLWTPSAHFVLFRAGYSLGTAGLFAATVEYFRNLEVQANERLGPDHADTLGARHNVAHGLGEAGNAAGAVAALDTLLTDRLRALGPDHPDIVVTRSSLARWRGEAGDAAGAAAASEALLPDLVRVLGPDHPATLVHFGYLARWRAEAGDPVGALAAGEALRGDFLRLFGPDHPNTLITRYHLALWRAQTGDPDTAVAAFEAVLVDFCRVLGADHPYTLATRHHLARLRGEAGDPAAAVVAFEAVLADRLRVLGPAHPDTLTTRHQLAHWRHALKGRDRPS